MAGKLTPTLDAFARVLPILGWLPTYEPKWLRADIIAGLTLWGILVPEAIAYAVMAGAPLQAGLYTLLSSLVLYAILGTTRQAVSAPTSGSSIMMAAVVAPFLVTGPKETQELLVLLVLVVGIIFLLCGLLRLGFVTAFISHSVMTGFIFGLAIHIAVSQAPKLFGLPRGHGETVYQLGQLIGQLDAANWVTFAIGAGALALLYVLEARTPRAPAPLMIMVAGILVVSVLRLSDEYGVQIVGTMCRPRRALLHLSYSSAPFYADGAFVTHAPFRTFNLWSVGKRASAFAVPFQARRGAVGMPGWHAALFSTLPGERTQ